MFNSVGRFGYTICGETGALKIVSLIVISVEGKQVTEEINIVVVIGSAITIICLFTALSTSASCTLGSPCLVLSFFTALR